MNDYEELELERIKVKERDAEIADMYRRLGQGTLHEPHCNSNKHSPVGLKGGGCSCTLGRRIRALEVRAEKAEDQFQELLWKKDR
jgi:hypothetical protein